MTTDKKEQQRKHENHWVVTHLLDSAFKSLEKQRKMYLQQIWISLYKTDVLKNLVNYA